MIRLVNAAALGWAALVTSFSVIVDGLCSSRGNAVPLLPVFICRESQLSLEGKKGSNRSR